MIATVSILSVRPPKKSWKNISNLSGGEKTLSSLALVGLRFAFMGPLHKNGHMVQKHLTGEQTTLWDLETNQDIGFF